MDTNKMEVMNGYDAEDAGRKVIGANRGGKVTKEFLLEHGDGVSYSMVTCNDEAMKHMARKAATICRRRFKPQDVVLLCLLDEDEEGDAGVAFTTEGIFCWEEDDIFQYYILYSDIKSVDYDSNGVRIIFDEKDSLRISSFLSQMAVNVYEGDNKRITSGCVTLPCVCYEIGLDEEEEKEYIREMYNFIADIIDSLSE